MIAGCGSNNTVEALEHTRFAKEVGAEASLHVAGYYNKPSATGFLRHFQLLADSVDLPLIVYNIPGRVGKNIDNETMLALAEHPNIVGVKEASGDIDQMMDLILRRPPGFTVLSGDDAITLPLMALGGNGIISVTSNLLPAKMVDLVQRMLDGDTAAGARRALRDSPGDQRTDGPGYQPDTGQGGNARRRVAGGELPPADDPADHARQAEAARGAQGTRHHLALGSYPPAASSLSSGVPNVG